MACFGRDTGAAAGRPEDGVMRTAETVGSALPGAKRTVEAKTGSLTNAVCFPAFSLNADTVLTRLLA